MKLRIISFLVMWVLSINFLALNSQADDGDDLKGADLTTELEGYNLEEVEESEQPVTYEDEANSAEINQTNKNITYVPMPNPEKPKDVFLSMEGPKNLFGTLGSIGRKMTEFVGRVSRGKVKMSYQVGLVRTTPLRGPNKVRLVLKPGAHSRVPVIGNSITAKHELMHQFGLGHANTRLWSSQTKINSFSSSKDQTDPMTISPGVNSLNVPHIHFLKWFTDTEEAYVDEGEYNLKVINDGSRDFKSLKALYYEVPETQRKYWFAYVIITSKFWNTPEGMPPRRGIAVYSSTPTASGTYFEGFIGANPKTNERTGLKFEVLEANDSSVKVKISKDLNWKLIGQ